jgi:predicted kinase
MKNENKIILSKIGIVLGLVMVGSPIFGITWFSLYFAVIGFVLCLYSSVVHSLLQPIKNCKKLIIIRGLPGSGKSTLAKNLAGKTGIVHSVDDFFLKDGVYKFEEDKLTEYHDLNLYVAVDSMEKGISPIIIDNTNLMSMWCISYVTEAKLHNYEVLVEETQVPWRFDVEELFRRNIHGVPKERLQTMKDIYEPLETFKKNLRI